MREKSYPFAAAENVRLWFCFFAFLLTVGSEFSSSILLVRRLAPHTEIKERLKKVADNSRLVGGRFDQKDNYL